MDLFAPMIAERESVQKEVNWNLEEEIGTIGKTSTYPLRLRPSRHNTLPWFQWRLPILIGGRKGGSEARWTVETYSVTARTTRVVILALHTE